MRSLSMRSVRSLVSHSVHGRAGALRRGALVCSALVGAVLAGCAMPVDYSEPECEPTTCAAAAKNCGTFDAGCGVTLECGSCNAPASCGGGGIANVCGEGPCVPTSCAAAGKDCGTASDGCGATLECGTCTAPATCGGGGIANVCGESGVTGVRLRLVAANASSGNNQAYEAPGIRILQGLHPDIAFVQEFNYASNSAADIATFVATAFGAEFQYFREEGQIPNGIVSRYPILAAGEWDDPEVANRDFAWARIDIPGPVDLWAVSLHLLTASATVRNREAQTLVTFVQASVPAGDYLVIGGDLNTDSRSESCITTLRTLAVAATPYPADQAGNDNTSMNRNKPYDWVLANAVLDALEVPVVIDTVTVTSGLVFDSRVFTPLTAVAPVQASDSGATNMQHMPVVRDFALP